MRALEDAAQMQAGGLREHGKRSVAKYRSGECRREADEVVDEVRYKVELDGRVFCTVTCSPWNVAELAVGRALVEGRLIGRSVKRVQVDDSRSLVFATTVPDVSSSFPRERPCSVPAHGLGLSRASFPAEPSLEPAEVSRLAMQLEAASELFRRTGGVHGAALVRDGKMLAYFADMGRHNAADKLVGWCHLGGVDASECVMLFSGRLPLEIMEKVAAIGCPVVIACGAPTNQSLDFAQERGVTVIGFAKGDRFNVYTHPWRVRIPADADVSCAAEKMAL